MIVLGYMNIHVQYAPSTILCLGTIMVLVSVWFDSTMESDATVNTVFDWTYYRSSGS